MQIDYSQLQEWRSGDYVIIVMVLAVTDDQELHLTESSQAHSAGLLYDDIGVDRHLFASSSEWIK